MNLALPQGITLQAVRAPDFEGLLALRMRAMRESLERLGRYDEARGRERLADGFDPANTWHVVAQGRRVGFIAFKRLSHAYWIKHFYIEPAEQGRGVGAAVLQALLAQADAEQVPVELAALKESPANRFYLRHGFAAIGEGEWDIDYLRVPLADSVRVVRGLWGDFQARRWAAAQARLHPRLQARWWTSGERFDGAEAFIDVQRRYPEGWTLRLIECERLEDGRVLSLVRVDQPPGHFYATSFARLDEGVITAIDEFWATAEPPPAWRTPEAFAGLTRFDALDDPRAVVA